MARVLIFGSNGMLGRRLVEVFLRRHEVLPIPRRSSTLGPGCEISDREAVLSLIRDRKPDWVVNAAAYTAVDLAEKEEALAFAANEEGPRNLAIGCASVNARLLHFSTDFVFSGELDRAYVESDKVGPVGAYARSKEAGERAVKGLLPERHVILRVSWLFGPDGKNFVSTILRFARERGVVRVVADQTGTPTYTRDAAEESARIVEAGLVGTVHCSNVGRTSWHEFAKEAIRIAGVNAGCEAIKTEDWPTPARRPKNSALQNAVLEETIGNRMRPWPEALSDYIREC